MNCRFFFIITDGIYHVFFWKIFDQLKLFTFPPNHDLPKLLVLWNGQFWKKSDCSLERCLVFVLLCWHKEYAYTPNQRYFNAVVYRHHEGIVWPTLWHTVTPSTPSWCLHEVFSCSLCSPHWTIFQSSCTAPCWTGVTRCNMYLYHSGANSQIVPTPGAFSSQVQTCDQRFGHELCRPSYIYGAFNSRHFLFIRMSIFFPAMTDSFSGPWVWCLTERNLSGCNLFPLDVFVLSLKWNCQLGDRIWTWRLSF